MPTTTRTPGTLVLCLASLVFGSPARASDEVSVPPQVQARLLAKAAAYDRNLQSRSGSEVLIIILVKPGSSRSEQSAEQLRQALKQEPVVAGLAHRETLVPFRTAGELAALVGQDHAAIVYVAAGFDQRDVVGLAQALAGGNVLTVAAAAADVQSGLVLGFDLVSGRPRLLVQLKQARRQSVNFASDFLQLAQVVE